MSVHAAAVPFRAARPQGQARAVGPKAQEQGARAGPVATLARRPGAPALSRPRYTDTPRCPAERHQPDDGNQRSLSRRKPASQGAWRRSADLPATPCQRGGIPPQTPSPWTGR
jgi:hypothetical protein